MEPGRSLIFETSYISFSRALKKSASFVLKTREAYLVKRRSFQDSNVSRFTFHISRPARTVFLSILGTVLLLCHTCAPSKF